jgi:hypothetical protein
MSPAKSVPNRLNPQECKRTKLCKPPPVPYIPEKDKVQEEVAKLRNLQIKTSLEKDTTLFPIRGSQAFGITNIHTQIITAFYVGIKLETLQKQPFQSSLHFGKVGHPANNSSSKTLPP